MNKIILISSLFFVSLPTFAGNQVSDLSREMKDASPYEVLKKAFDESTDPIHLREIGVDGQKCASAAATDTAPQDDGPLSVVRSHKVIAPAIPAQAGDGPLFPPKPAVPAQVSTKVGVVDENGLTQDQLDSLYDGIDAKVTPTEISFYATSTPDLTLQNSPYKFIARKNGEVITYMVNAGIEAFGYCWKE